MNRKLLFTVASSLLVSGSAIAADMPVKAPVPVVEAAYNWSGFYAGINDGWASEHFTWTYTNPVPFIPPQGINRTENYLGGHVGYQYQWQQIVLGVEAAISIPTSGGGFGASVGCIPSSPLSRCEARATTLTTVGGRLGWANGKWLFFGSGGWASLNINTRELTVPPVVFDITQTHRHDGSYVGGGVEYALLSNLIFGVEYQHVEVQTLYHASSGDVFGPSPPGVNGRNVNGKEDIVRGRISLKLGPTP